MLRALYTSSNSLLDQQTSIDCISSNVANVNTVGFKKTKTTFEDILSQTIQHGTTSQNPMQIGLGSKLASTDLIFSQGTILPTDNPTDVALEGNGFFIINPAENPSDKYLFTRAGNFTFDADSRLVTPNGDFVLGWLASTDINEHGEFNFPIDESTGMPSGDIGKIDTTNFKTLPAVASSYVRFKANLNGGNEIKEFTPLHTESDTANRADFNTILLSDGSFLDMKDGDNFQLSFDGGISWHTYEYDNNGSVTPSASGFRTMEDLIDAMQRDLGNDATVTLDDGKLKITNNTLADMDIQIREATQNNNNLISAISLLARIVKPNSYVETQTFNLPAHTVESIFYDSNGNRHKIDIAFRKIGENRWFYNISLPDNEGTLTNNTGIVTFDDDGGLDSNIHSPTVGVTLQGQTESMNLLINLWNTDSGNYENNKYSGLTQFALPSSTSYQTQDGSTAGEMEKVNIDLDGYINASYTNGKSCRIAKLAIAKFTNPQGLKKVGNTMFEITANTDSQDVLESKSYIGVANHGGRGTVLSSKLEMSNVDLAEEFTDMIVFQRGFQASAKSVTTADEIIQTAIQLKR